jgi:3-hydroxyisobutyrate dehydrogenase-like beta-hydroxyacid dehydrogenase
MTTIGIVSPGAMGSALGRTWASCGTRVVTTLDGRSARTRSLARGLEVLPVLADVLAVSDVVVSVCPPGAASSIAATVLDMASGPATFADLNAISPTECTELAARFEESGWDFIDGSISGGPPPSPSARPTLLYLSGERAEALAGYSTNDLIPKVVGTEAGVASAIKMCTASVYKGTKALWLQALTTAAHFGVQEVVLEDLAGDYPDTVAAAPIELAMAASKAHRYVAEMENIAATQDSAGFGPELFAAMATIYTRIAASPLAELTPEDAEAVSDMAVVLRGLI